MVRLNEAGAGSDGRETGSEKCVFARESLSNLVWTFTWGLGDRRVEVRG